MVNLKRFCERCGNECGNEYDTFRAQIIGLNRQDRRLRTDLCTACSDELNAWFGRGRK